jgi:hypothetical protein
MTLKYEGKKYFGWGVLPAKSSYEFEVESPGEIDLIRVSTCARLDTDEPGGGIFKDEHEYDYDYKPDIELEQVGSCPLRVEGFEAGVPGRHSFGLFELAFGPEKLPAVTTCNGRKKPNNGVSMCVSREGLNQRITFKTPVMLLIDSLSDRCKIQLSPDGLAWDYTIRKRECVYVFKSLNNDDMHRHLTVGYEETPVRRYK